jgi:hypothetical protein
MRLFLFVFFLCFSNSLLAQSTIDSLEVDNKYREDQFYFSATYNLLGDKPSGVSQRGFSTGFHIGFIRDMPINKKRNLAIGIGFGLSTNSYNQNLLISEINNTINYSVINEDEISFSKNKFTTYLIEAPFEFRWRTSTAKDYKFWRIYTGFKVGYLVYNSSKFNGSIGDVKIANNTDFNDFQYGLTLSIGYSTFNFYMYYSLNNVFEDSAKIDGQTIEINAIKLGLIVYFL